VLCSAVPWCVVHTVVLVLGSSGVVLCSGVWCMQCGVVHTVEQCRACRDVVHTVM
jgi:hypothetical protein